MNLVYVRSTIVSAIALTVILLFIRIDSVNAAPKLLEIGDKLAELIEKYPDKSWLIEFYVPWCHHCKEMEFTYMNVAEKIYHRHDNLVVGRVDCTKYRPVCQNYDVGAYPTIFYLTQNTRLEYTGDRTEKSLLSFADRALAPDVNTANDCDHLKEVTLRHEVVTISTMTNSSNKLQLAFESVARDLKQSHWFYHSKRRCNDLDLKENGIYILKGYSKQASKFQLLQEEGLSLDDIKRSISFWIYKNSLPIYGQISFRNLEQYVTSGRLIVVALLDEYRPAKLLAASSREFDKSFHGMARKYADDKSLLFAWTSEVELVVRITLGEVRFPNALLLKSDLSFHLVVPKNESNQDNGGDRISERLMERNLTQSIREALNGKIVFEGGNSFLWLLMSETMSVYSKLDRMFRGNPLLMTLLVGFPCVALSFVLYTNCYLIDDEEDYIAEQQQLLANNHLKQD